MRNSVAIALLLVLVPPLDAFDTGHHRDMTIAALRKEGFSDDAINVIVLQNWLVDWYAAHGDRKLHPLVREHEDYIIVAETKYLHFDSLIGRNVGESIARDYWTTLAKSTSAAIVKRLRAKQPDVLGILTLLGVSLHMVQDFYTHSNWVGDPREDPKGNDVSPYLVSTWLDLADRLPIAPQVPRVMTGMFPDKDGEKTGNVTHAMMNKDNSTINKWDRAYAAGYIATRQWIQGLKAFVEKQKPGFWTDCIQGAVVQGADAIDLRNNLESSYLVSEYVGKWKGGGKQLANELSPFLYFRGQTSIFTKAFSQQFVYADLSRDIGHPEIRQKFPAGVAPPVFSNLNLSEEAIVLHIPVVKSLNYTGVDEDLNDQRMYARIHMSGGGVDQDFTEDTQFGNRGLDPFPWKTILMVPKSTQEITITISLFNEGTDSRVNDYPIDINQGTNGGVLTFKFMPQQSRCSVGGPVADCSASAHLRSRGSQIPLAAIEAWVEKRDLIE